MAAKSVFCLVPDEARASRIVDDLKMAGFSNTDISVLLPDTEGTRDFAHEKNTKAPEGATTGGVAGGVVGGRSAGSLVLARWRFRASGLLLQRGQSWPR